MWMLVATLCVQLDGANAECRKIVAEVGAPVLFLGVKCEWGNDA